MKQIIASILFTILLLPTLVSQQVFAAPVASVFDIDGNQEVKPLSDGLLSLRFLFGFRGNSLISNAIGGNSARTTADEIEVYLRDHIGDLDIDGNGEAKALSDGLLLLRYLFGFRNNSLINQAVGAGATRSTADAIEKYIISGGSTTLRKGFLIDSPIAGVTYTCGDITGTTTLTGEFFCKAPPVTFKIGGFTLGTISEFTADNKIFPQDLVGVRRSNFNDPRLIKLIRLLQSLDADGNIQTEIIIPPEVATKFGANANDLSLEELASLAGVTLVSETDAIKHLQKSITTIETFSHALDGRSFVIGFCKYNLAEDPTDDTYYVGSYTMDFKDGLWQNNNNGYHYPYQYTLGRRLILATPNLEVYPPTMTSELFWFENIGGDRWQNVSALMNNEEPSDIVAIWSSEERMRDYMDAVISKVERTCEVSPGPDVSL